MGNSCFCGNINFVKDVKLNVCYQKQEIIDKSDQILVKEEKESTNEKNKENEEKDKNKSKNKMNEIFNYFNDVEKELMNNFKKRKVKKHPSGKRINHIIIKKEENKYELMLKRLLEQQSIKKVGPKRRETIRNNGEEKIKDMVKNLLIENKNDILNKKNKNDKNENENSSLLIKKQFNKKERFSVSVDRNAFFMNNLNSSNKKKSKGQLFNPRNSISEVIGEINGSDIYRESSIESEKKC